MIKTDPQQPSPPTADIVVSPEDILVPDQRTGEVRRGDEVTWKTIFVYVCPTPECGDYYGSGNMPDLSTSWNGPKVEDQGEREMKGQSRYTNNRQSCPACRERGVDVQRVLIQTQVPVPKQGPPTPELPVGHVPPSRLKVTLIQNLG